VLLFFRLIAFAVAQIRAKSYFEDVDFHTLASFVR
jgi:hypothetical protein